MYSLDGSPHTINTPNSSAQDVVGWAIPTADPLMPVTTAGNQQNTARSRHTGGVNAAVIAVDGSQLIAPRDTGPITITATEAGLRRAPLEALTGAGPEENADWLSTLLQGKTHGAHADAVALNAGTLAWIVGLRSTLRESVVLAREALAGGGGARRLSRLVELSNGA